MEKQTFTIPNISCGHCVMAIKNELSELDGVNTVEGDPQSKQVQVEWDVPATLEKIKATLKEAGIFAAVQALHPTPALAGQPRQAAMQMIRDAEPQPRGAYGAPVGWITPQGDGELAVAIRSAVFRQKEGLLYAGCGLLAASDPQKEWQETVMKFRPMMGALGLEESVPSPQRGEG